MKKYSAALAALILTCALALTACAPTPQPIQTASPPPSATPAPAQTAPVSTGAPAQEALFTLDQYPVVDGSTANLPLMAAVMSQLTGLPLEEAEALTTCATTPYAYQNLLDGKVDLLLVYEPAEETRAIIDERAQSGDALEFMPIGRDALVFITNQSNPVKSLTTQQLLDIYTGKTANWKDLGGEDKDIAAFQRASASGSQALFMKLLMKDVTPMEAPTAFYPTEMGELIEQLATYNNEGNALGFSVFYYANYMYAKPGLAFMAIDGVTPSDQTIADGSYPFLNEFYAVVRADSPQDSPARQVAQWLGTQEGIQCITAAGYIPVG